MVKLELLDNEGNFKHNTVLKTGEGFLVVARRASPGTEAYDPTEYLPCEFRKKYFLKTLLWHHVPQCTVHNFYKVKADGTHDDGKTSTHTKNFIRRGRSLLNSALLPEDETLLTHMLNRMNDREVKGLVVKDPLIKRYAILHVESLGHVQKKNDMHRVSQNCRILARLVFQARKKNMRYFRQFIENGKL